MLLGLMLTRSMHFSDKSWGKTSLNYTIEDLIKMRRGGYKPLYACIRKGEPNVFREAELILRPKGEA